MTELGPGKSEYRVEFEDGRQPTTGYLDVRAAADVQRLDVRLRRIALEVALRRLTIGCVAIVLGIGAALARAQAPDSRLTIADVEKISGLKGITQAPGVDPWCGAAQLPAVSKPLPMVNLDNARFYDGAKKIPITSSSALVPGLGDEAFDGPTGTLQYALYVKKGAKAFSLATFFVPRSRPMQPRLTMDQLKAAARIILSRL